MKKRVFTCLVALLPLAAQAKWDIEGTPDDNGDGHGDLQAGYTYEFGAHPNRDGYTDSKVLGISSIMGEWWTASSSGSPWDNFVASPDYEKQPSFHITDELNGGDSFFVGLSMQNQMNDYTSEFRMANDLFGAGAKLYFGLRNVTDPSVLEQHTAASAAAASTVDGVTLMAGDPIFGDKGHISLHQGLLYKGHSTGIGDMNHVPDTDTFDVSMFEWTHFETDSIDDDITFTIKKGGGASSFLELTEWVVFIELPETMSTIAGEQWADAPVNDASRLDDVVFSWTVHGKEGYTLTPEGTPLENPTYDDPDAGIFRNVPEPSSALLLLGGMSVLLGRRQRRI